MNLAVSPGWMRGGVREKRERLSSVWMSWIREVVGCVENQKEQ